MPLTVSEADLTTASITKNFTLGAGDKIMLWSDMEKSIPKCEAYIVE